MHLKSALVIISSTLFNCQKLKFANLFRFPCKSQNKQTLQKRMVLLVETQCMFTAQ